MYLGFLVLSLFAVVCLPPFLLDTLILSKLPRTEGEQRRYTQRSRVTSAVSTLCLTALWFLLTGCSAAPPFPDTGNTSANTTAPLAPSGGLGGSTWGGQVPIVGARIYLLAAGTTGYGSPATSLLTSASYPGYPAQQDESGRYYVLTDASGAFQIVDTCTPGQQVYLASLGGVPGLGLGNNRAANEIAIVGQCPIQGNFDSTLTGVFVSEVSTVAAAYAAAAYATDTFDIGSPTTTAIQQTGIANAFANAANLYDVQDVNGLARQASISGNGVVPQAKIDTIANVLASCVYSGGPSSPACSLLFSATVADNISQAPPTDVTTAAIRIAHHPWANVSSLYSLQGLDSPFFPQLTSAPNDFTIALSFSNAALGKNPSLAVDATGNVWTVTPGGAAVSKLSPMGTLLSGASGYAIGGGFANAGGLAIDSSNNVWILGQGTAPLSLIPVPTFAELSNVGIYQKILTESATGLNTHPPSAATNLALDGLGNFFYSAEETTASLFRSTTCCTEQYNLSSHTFTDLDAGNTTPGTNIVAVNSSAQWATSSGNSVSEISAGGKLMLNGGGLSTATGVALDNAGNAWIVSAGSNMITEFSPSGTLLSGSSGYSGNLSAPASIAIDGAANVWVMNSSGSLNLSEFSSTGAAIGSGYSESSLSSAGAMAIDASGSIWVASSTSTNITQFLGLAAPVITPMAAAVSSNSVGLRP